MPKGSTFGDFEPAVAVRAFRSADQTGTRSTESVLGELIFESPRVLGGLARDIGMSCDTCHTRGGSNPDFFIPGGSTHPGTFNGARTLFNPAAPPAPATAITIPSLFSIASRQHFGHDGRRDTLTKFLLDVIVKEFAGAPPKPAVLDYLSIYISDLERRPNHRLGVGGLLVNPTEAERRGEILFAASRPGFEMGCASCHRPGLDFSDNDLHASGTNGKLLRTPSLLDHIDGKPYFHDGRTESLADAVREENAAHAFGYTPEDEAALTAYVGALGKVDKPDEPLTAELSLREIEAALDALRLSISAGDADVVAIAADGFASRLQELALRFEDPLGNETHQQDRRNALSAIADAALATFRLRSLAEEKRDVDLEPAFEALRESVEAMKAPVRAGQDYSLFDPERLKAYRKKIGHPM